MRFRVHGWAVGVCFWALSGCDEKPESAAAAPSDAPARAAPIVSATVKPALPPSFEIDTQGAKVGFERALLDQRDGRYTLNKLLSPTAQFVDGQDVRLLVDRNAKLPWVSAFIDELAALGAKHVLVSTETRKEYPSNLAFSPELTLKSAAPCSPLAMVLKDRGTAVWKLSGGVAIKHGKGMAGPDLSMTGDNIEHFAKACKQANLLFVSAAPSVEWGLAYDLAASSKTLPNLHFDAFVLLGDTPVPGNAVTLRK
jgi:hypothetical protein